MNAKIEMEIGRCIDCKQGYTKEGYAAYPDHIELCSLHAAAPKLLEALKENIYSAIGAEMVCNDCGSEEDEPHEPHCELGQLIAEAEGR